jgi:hypothetical protein
MFPMSNNENDKKLSIKLPFNIDIANTRIQERKILEFVPYTIKSGQAIIVRTKKNAGLSERCYVVCNRKGKISITPIEDVKKSTEVSKKL